MLAVYDYTDFGPQGLAMDLIGPQWWQWHNHGSSDPKVVANIKVVVYAYGGKEVAMTKYIVNPATESDYRYLSRGMAMDFLETNLAELDAMTIEKDGVTFPKIAAQLKATHTRIQTDVCDNT